MLVLVFALPVGAGCSSYLFLLESGKEVRSGWGGLKPKGVRLVFALLPAFQ